MTTHPITRDVLAASWRSWWDDQAPRVEPRWLRLLWTLLFSLAVALLVSGLGVAFSRQPSHVLADAPVLTRLFASNLALASTVGFAIHLLLAVGRQVVGVDRLARLQGWQRSAYYALVPLLGVAISMPVGAWIAHVLFGMRMLFDADLVLGAVTVSLLITVHDNGLGLAAPVRSGRKGNGVALQNVRQRLLSRFGSAAALTLEEAWPGTRATLRMPLSSAPPSASTPLPR
jgi:hypothetical protein